MAERKYRNFKEFSANYIGGWTFADGEKSWTIKDVVSDLVKNHKDGSEEEKILIYFNESDLPLVLNSTNNDSITSATGSAAFEDWIGKRITLYTKKVRAFGDVWDAVRIRDEAPKEPVKAEPASEAQINRLQALISEGMINEPAFLKHCRISRIQDVSADQAKAAIRAKTGEIVE